MIEGKSPSSIIFERMQSYGPAIAICKGDKKASYTDLLKTVDTWVETLQSKGIGQGDPCALIGDFSLQTCALMFALIKVKAITVPLTSDVKHELEGFMDLASVQHCFTFNTDDSWNYQQRKKTEEVKLLKDFRETNEPGLIVFTSGSSGKPKGILHNVENVLKKFVQVRKGWRTVLFLLMDHFGGYNTFLSSFAYGGTAICPMVRTAESVAEAISVHKANLLPTTPTFLNLLIIGQFHKTYDFSSIELITYGTEMMADHTLQKSAEIFPNAVLKQTYGMSEIGVLRSSSESNDSLWLKVGGDGFQIKVVDNTLWVKAESNMIGYLNAPQPFDEEGWMSTGDQVEVKGDLIRFLGRKSEIINIGGKKVFPSEVEETIMKAGNIHDVTVFAKEHPIMGQVVHAKVTVIEEEDQKALTERLRKFCNDNLAKYKVPLKFLLTKEDEVHHSSRFKKIRRE